MKLILILFVFHALVSAANCPPIVAERTLTSEYYGPDGRLERTEVEQGRWLRYQDGSLLVELRPADSTSPVRTRFVKTDGRVFVMAGQAAEYRESGRQAPPCLMIGQPERSFEPSVFLNGYLAEVLPHWVSRSRNEPRQLGGRAYYSRELRLMLKTEVRLPGPDGRSVLRKEELHSIQVAPPDEALYPAPLRETGATVACAACPRSAR